MNLHAEKFRGLSSTLQVCRALRAPSMVLGSMESRSSRPKPFKRPSEGLLQRIVSVKPDFAALQVSYSISSIPNGLPASGNQNVGAGFESECFLPLQEPLEFTGYHAPLWKLVVYCVCAALTGGWLFLLVQWSLKVQLKLLYQRCKLQEAEHVLVKVTWHHHCIRWPSKDTAFKRMMSSNICSRLKRQLASHSERSSLL